jgi:hypothetical protein
VVPVYPSPGSPAPVANPDPLSPYQTPPQVLPPPRVMPPSDVKPSTETTSAPPQATMQSLAAVQAPDSPLVVLTSIEFPESASASVSFAEAADSSASLGLPLIRGTAPPTHGNGPASARGSPGAPEVPSFPLIFVAPVQATLGLPEATPAASTATKSHATDASNDISNPR